MTESRPIDDAKAMEVIESDVNSLFFRTEEQSSGSPGSKGPDNLPQGRWYDQSDGKKQYPINY